MLFIDGSWLYHIRPYLVNLDGRPDFELDYKAIPLLVSAHLEKSLGARIDLVRTCYFGSVLVNKPGHDNLRERQFYEMLNKRCSYATEIYEYDFRTRETGRRETCLEVGLTSSALLHTFQPGVLDVACILAGDMDYIPLLKTLRASGKRTLLIAVKGSNGFYPTNPRLLDENNLWDFSPLFLDEHIQELQFQRVESTRICDSCGKEELTTFTSDWFYCKSCRDEYRQLRSKQVSEA